MQKILVKINWHSAYPQMLAAAAARLTTCYLMARWALLRDGGWTASFKHPCPLMALSGHF